MQFSGVYRGSRQGTLVTVGPPLVTTPNNEGFAFEIAYGQIAHTGVFQAGEVTATSFGTLAADGSIDYTIINEFLFSLKVTARYTGRLTVQPGGTTAIASGTFTQTTVTQTGALFSSITDGTWSIPSTPLTFPAGAGRLTNVSTRGSVETGDAIMIAGFVIQGAQPRRVILRVLGPSLVPFGVANTLANPRVRVVNSAGTEVAANDDWAAAANASEVTAANLAPGDSRESALALSLAPGAYTALVSGVNDATGVAIVEVYDLETESSGARLSNLSTRASVRTGDAVEIVGFAIRGGSRKVIIRGLGPSLSAFFPNFLANPTLTLFDSNQQPIATSDSWMTANLDAITLAGLAPGSPLEAALLIDLPPANYTAILSGVGGTSGIGLVEIYEVP